MQNFRQEPKTAEARKKAENRITPPTFLPRRELDCSPVARS
jgi:hypothetical protein